MSVTDCEGRRVISRLSGFCLDSLANFEEISDEYYTPVLPVVLPVTHSLKACALSSFWSEFEHPLKAGMHAGNEQASCHSQS